MEHFTGIWPALVTPLTGEERVNVAVARRLVDHLIDVGVGGFFVGGTTGEGVLLPLGERRQIAETVVEQANGRVPIIVHIGALAAADAMALAAHAQEIGADGVASLPPFYYPVGFDGIRAYYEQLTRSCSLPVYIYHIPRFSGVPLVAEELWALCQIPGVRGLKYSTFDIRVVEQLLAWSEGQLDVFSGPDQLLLPMLSAGVRAAIGMSYNVLAAHFVNIYDTFQPGDWDAARKLQAQANRVIEVLLKHGGIPAVKATLRMLGFDCGVCRRPLARLNEGQVAALRADLEAVGFWQMV